jgi:FkbM family methyltransferase
MLKFIKRRLKKYKAAIYLVDLIRAIKKISINIDSLREFNAKRRGFIDLSKGNFEFYSNIFKNLVHKTEVEGGIDSIFFLDVGANDGWFAKNVYRFLGEHANVISFEPLRSMIPSLELIRSRYKSYHYENLAIGRTNNQVEIVEYSTSGLSSMKRLSQDYAYNQHYDTKVVNTYPVNVICIDQYLKDNQIKAPLILKVDTQGFEFEVLNGAKQALLSRQIKAIIIEVMTVEKYKNETLYKEIFDFIHSYGFTVFDMHPSYYEPDGRLSEIDCCFILSEKSNYV